MRDLIVTTTAMCNINCMLLFNEHITWMSDAGLFETVGGVLLVTNNKFLWVLNDVGPDTYLACFATRQSSAYPFIGDS